MNYKSFKFKKKVAKPECISKILFQQQEMNFLYQKFQQSFALSTLPTLIFICTYVANYIEKRDLEVYSLDFGTGKTLLLKFF